MEIEMFNVKIQKIVCTLYIYDNNGLYKIYKRTTSVIQYNRQPNVAYDKCNNYFNTPLTTPGAIDFSYLTVARNVLDFSVGERFSYNQFCADQQLFRWILIVNFSLVGVFEM